MVVGLNREVGERLSRRVYQPPPLNTLKCDVKSETLTEIQFRLEQALDHLERGKSNRQYDPSWCRPKLLSRQEVNESCEQAYHQIHAVLNMIPAIQKDAFDAGWNTGWKQGMEDSLDMRSKGADPQRAIDAWKPDSQHNTPCSKKGES